MYYFFFCILKTILIYTKKSIEFYILCFQSLIVDLDRESGDYKEEISIKTAIMSFINAALNYGPGQVRNSLYPAISPLA